MSIFRISVHSSFSTLGTRTTKTPSSILATMPSPSTSSFLSSPPGGSFTVLSNTPTLLSDVRSHAQELLVPGPVHHARGAQLALLGVPVYADVLLLGAR